MNNFPYLGSFADCLPIKSGKLLGLKTCAVLTGYALLNDVENCSPDLIIKDITDFDISNLL